MFFVNFPYQSTNLIPAVCGTLHGCWWSYNVLSFPRCCDPDSLPDGPYRDRARKISWQTDGADCADIPCSEEHLLRRRRISCPPTHSVCGLPAPEIFSHGLSLIFTIKTGQPLPYCSEQLPCFFIYFLLYSFYSSARIAQRIFVERARGFCTHSCADGRTTSLEYSL